MAPHQSWVACLSLVPVLLSKARPLKPDVEITLVVLMKKARPLPPDVEIILTVQMQIIPCTLSDI